MNADRLHLKVIQVNRSSGETDYLIADYDMPVKDVLLGAGAVYCQVADRLTGDIFVRAVNSHADLLSALKDACEEIDSLRRYANDHGGMYDHTEYREGLAAISKASSPALQASGGEKP